MTTTTNQTERMLQFYVAGITRLKGGVWQVKLSPENRVIPSFYAGQYLKLILPDEICLPYSIASSPSSEVVELHIQCYRDHSKATQVINFLSESFEKQSPIEVQMPFGYCYLSEVPVTDLVFVAAGSGFSQVKSMVEYCFDKKVQGDKIHVYWGVRRPEGFYLPDLPQQWRQDYGVNYHPVVSESTHNDDWEGRMGSLFQAVQDDIGHLKAGYFYISGSPEMVYATKDAITSSGISSSHIRSDVFEYAPR